MPTDEARELLAHLVEAVNPWTKGWRYAFLGWLWAGDVDHLYTANRWARTYLARTAPEGSGFDPVERARARGRAQASQPPPRPSAQGAREVAHMIASSFGVAGTDRPDTIGLQLTLDATDRIKYYAEERVREALEKAATRIHVFESEGDGWYWMLTDVEGEPDSDTDGPHDCPDDAYAEAIRALIPKETPE